jgi:hypothetical protein
MLSRLHIPFRLLILIPLLALALPLALLAVLPLFYNQSRMLPGHPQYLSI